MSGDCWPRAESNPFANITPAPTPRTLNIPTVVYQYLGNFNVWGGVLNMRGKGVNPKALNPRPYNIREREQRGHQSMWHFRGLPEHASGKDHLS